MSDVGESLPDEAVLWRRVPPSRRKLAEGSNDGVLPQGNAFRSSAGDDGVSVGIASVFEAQGKGPEAMLEGDEFDDQWGVLAITAGDVREVGMDVHPDSPDHALLLPKPSSSGSSKLTKRSAWVVEPSSRNIRPRTP